MEKNGVAEQGLSPWRCEITEDMKTKSSFGAPCDALGLTTPLCTLFHVLCLSSFHFEAPFLRQICF